MRFVLNHMVGVTLALLLTALANTIASVGASSVPHDYSPDSPRFDHHSVAIALANAGRHDEAHPAFEAAARVAPSCQTDVNVGASFLRAGKLKDAAPVFDAAWRKYPVCEHAKLNLQAFIESVQALPAVERDRILPLVGQVGRDYSLHKQLDELTDDPPLPQSSFRAINRAYARSELETTVRRLSTNTLKRSRSSSIPAPTHSQTSGR